MELCSAQISFFDQRFPPAPATRRQVVIQRNGPLSGRRSAALLQAPEAIEQVSQQYEDSAQEEEQPGPDQISQEPVPTQPSTPQRPLRTNGKPVPPPSRPVNGFTRVPPPPTQPPQQQKQDFGQTLVSAEEGECLHVYLSMRSISMHMHVYLCRSSQP